MLTIGFDNDTHVFLGSQSIWPIHSSGNHDFQGFPENFDDVYYSSPDMFSPTASDLSVSNFYYHGHNLPKGIYFIVAINRNGERYNGNFVVQ